MFLDAALLSRIQFALTLSFHILFPSFTIGCAMFLVIWEGLYLKTRNPVYYQLCRFWTKLFALAFGMGVVSGLVLSYEFGTNFSQFSAVAGNVLGPVMSYEVLTAFFLEAGFLGIMLFGWNSVSPALHYISTCLVAVGTMLSAFWILAANSWMHTPQGFEIKEGVYHVVNWANVIFNPSFPYRFTHMVGASLVTTTFLIAGVSAWYLRRKRETQAAQRAFSLAMWFALILTPLQIIVGDLHGLNTLKHQPIKLAAIEARWDRARSAPLTLFALPDQKAEINHYAVDVPYLGSLILTHELEGEVPGLKDVPPDQRPYVPIVFFSFRVMVGIGLLLLTIAVIGAYLRYRKRLFTSAKFLRWCLWISPLGYVAMLAGWYTTETGRQPWIVYGVMRTSEGVTPLPPETVLISLTSFAVLYSLLLGSFIYYLCYLVRQGISQAPLSQTPDRLTAWLETESDADTHEGRRG